MLVESSTPPSADEPVSSGRAFFTTIRRPLVEAVGLSGLVLIVGNALSAPNIVTNVLALSLVVTWTLASIGRKYFVRISIILLAVLCVALATTLAWVIHIKQDPWLEWSKALSKTVKQCPPTDDPCIAKALTIQRPAPASDLIASQLNNDLKAGDLFLQNDAQDEAIKKMLGRRLGIWQRFLGTGFAQPSDHDEYREARVAEYLCVNNSESDESVISWQLTPKEEYLEWTIEEIIKGERVERTVVNGKEVISTKQVSPINSKEKRDRLLQTIERRLGLRDPLPAVVRFQQLSSSSGSVGRSDAARVFFIHLGSVWRLKLREAAALSGYTLDPTTSKKFFVWVFLPSHEDEVVPATWGDIIKHLKDKEKPWIK